MSFAKHKMRHAGLKNYLLMGLKNLQQAEYFAISELLQKSKILNSFLRMNVGRLYHDSFAKTRMEGTVSCESNTHKSDNTLTIIILDNLQL